MKDSTNRREEPKNAMPRKSEEEKVMLRIPSYQLHLCTIRMG